ncbi:MAG: UDP-N-acetylmuramoyl-tripeptide--D-alanyl-D-alanine ligase [Rubricoccaceae bacterium]
MPFLFVLALLASAVAAWRAWRRVRHFLHVFQLEGYKRHEYTAWLRTRGAGRLWAPSHTGGLVLLGVLALLSARLPLGVGLPVTLGWMVAFASAVHVEREREKKPLAFTARMKRLASAALGLAALPVLAGAAGAFTLASPGAGLLALLGGWFLADLGAPAWVYFAGWLTEPVERRIQDGFKRRARATLDARPDLTVVAVTGSYGKTSTKFVIAEVVQQRFQTLVSPGSFNTPMGVCLVVNNQLRPDHRVLVLEMGARYSHDIQELTALAPPDIAVVTSVGVAHLETMGPIENIARVKGDLVAGLRPGGQAILNADDPRVAAMTARVPAHAGRVWTVSAEGREADITAGAITYGPEGARFTVRDDTGAEETVTTRLLGQHNVLNVLFGIAVGRALGLRLRQIAHAVGRVEPVAHRLALRREPNGVLTIDDAFNSNPVGARNAVEILSQMPVPEGGRRVIVTPGMVELGEAHEAENRTFGMHIAQHLTGERDLAVLVGPRQTAPIQDGLRAAGFPEERLHVVRSLFDARDLLAPLLREGDVVLYENDLPDTYAEN